MIHATIYKIESAATSDSTHITKIIRKQNNNLKQHTILFNFKSSLNNSEEIHSKNFTLFLLHIYNKVYRLNLKAFC